MWYIYIIFSIFYLHIILDIPLPGNQPLASSSTCQQRGCFKAWHLCSKHAHQVHKTSLPFQRDAPSCLSLRPGGTAEPAEEETKKATETDKIQGESGVDAENLSLLCMLDLDTVLLLSYSPITDITRTSRCSDFFLPVRINLLEKHDFEGSGARFKIQKNMQFKDPKVMK